METYKKYNVDRNAWCRAYHWISITVYTIFPAWSFISRMAKGSEVDRLILSLIQNNTNLRKRSN